MRTFLLLVVVLLCGVVPAVAQSVGITVKLCDPDNGVMLCGQTAKLYADLDPAIPGDEILVWHFGTFVPVRWHPLKHGTRGERPGPGLCVDNGVTPTMPAVTATSPFVGYDKFALSDVDGDGRAELSVFNSFDNSGEIEIRFATWFTNCR